MSGSSGAVGSVTALQSQPSASSRLSPHHFPPSALSSARRASAFLVPSHTAASPIPKLCWSLSFPFPLTLIPLRCRNSDHAPDSRHGRTENVTGKWFFDCNILPDELQHFIGMLYFHLTCPVKSFRELSLMAAGSLDWVLTSSFLICYKSTQICESKKNLWVGGVKSGELKILNSFINDELVIWIIKNNCLRSAVKKSLAAHP